MMVIITMIATWKKQWGIVERYACFLEVRYIS
jgi:hypothetical protein